MKLEKPLYILAIIFLLPFISSIAKAQTQITIKGQVWSNSCEVEIGSQNFTVNLGSNANKNFLDLDRRGPKKSFNIVLSRCGETARGAYLSFNGEQDPSNRDLLKLDSVPAAATGVAIMITNANGTQIPINKNRAVMVGLQPSVSNVINLNAELVSVRLPVTMGKFTATANFVLEYL
ncbi:fimbrial protein [Proteus vulgaris]|uniref:fimbrial protein n=1 Tax=Proteus vulgaris TaxID=585 RepID=UPI0034D6C04A